MLVARTTLRTPRGGTRNACRWSLRGEGHRARKPWPLRRRRLARGRSWARGTPRTSLDRSGVHGGRTVVPCVGSQARAHSVTVLHPLRARLPAQREPYPGLTVECSGMTHCALARKRREPHSRPRSSSISPMPASGSGTAACCCKCSVQSGRQPHWQGPGSPGEVPAPAGSSPGRKTRMAPSCPCWLSSMCATSSSSRSKSRRSSSRSATLRSTLGLRTDSAAAGGQRLGALGGLLPATAVQFAVTRTLRDENARSGSRPGDWRLKQWGGWGGWRRAAAVAQLEAHAGQAVPAPPPGHRGPAEGRHRPAVHPPVPSQLLLLEVRVERTGVRQRVAPPRLHSAQVARPRCLRDASLRPAVKMRAQRGGRVGIQHIACGGTSEGQVLATPIGTGVAGRHTSGRLSGRAPLRCRRLVGDVATPHVWHVMPWRAGGRAPHPWPRSSPPGTAALPEKCGPAGEAQHPATRSPLQGTPELLQKALWELRVHVEVARWWLGTRQAPPRLGPQTPQQVGSNAGTHGQRLRGGLPGHAGPGRRQSSLRRGRCPGWLTSAPPAAREAARAEAARAKCQAGRGRSACACAWRQRSALRCAALRRAAARPVPPADHLQGPACSAPDRHQVSQQGHQKVACRAHGRASLGGRRNDTTQQGAALLAHGTLPAQRACMQARGERSNAWGHEFRAVPCQQATPAVVGSGRGRPLTLQRALMHLVHQDVADAQQGGVPRQPAQQDAGGAEQQAGVPRGRGVQPHVVSHLAVLGGRGGGWGRRRAVAAGAGWVRWLGRWPRRALAGAVTEAGAGWVRRSWAGAAAERTGSAAQGTVAPWQGQA